ncbi:MAG TPA: winged helix-turn-helix domain-containing protein [Steroidobacteraceae bacterium]|nr:winged helix-turn-helix domain-containing protein [Steroidobacteraceae bacterium]
MDTERLEFRRNGITQSLEPQVFRLLAHLIENRHRVVTRNELYDTIWNGRVVAESALYSRIKSVRAAIGDDGADPIRTVSRSGYQFVAEVATPQSARAPEEVPQLDRARKRTWVAVAAVAAVAALLVTVTLNRQGSTPAAAASAVPTLAVLPFLDMSPGKDQEYFVDGLTEELTDQLSHIPGMRVVARTSTFAYKNRPEDLRTVARTLGAQNLLEGSVRRDGDQLRITAQLIDANGKHIWSQTFDRRREDIFAIQEEVSSAITAVLSVAVSATGGPAARGGTRNVDAYDAYIAARAALTDPALASPEQLALGLAQLERATTIDPNFATAWAWQTITYHRAGFLPQHGNPELLAKANRAAARAYELAPRESWVLVASALASMSEYEWAAAEEKFARARAAATGSENPWACSGCFALTVGRTDDALMYLQQAQDADPLFAANVLQVSYAHEIRREFDLADADNEAARHLDGAEPSVSFRRMFVAFSRRDPALIRANAIPNTGWYTLYQQLSAELDRPEKALADLHGAIKDQRRGETSSWGVKPAIWAAYLGDPRLALELVRPIALDVTYTRILWAPVFSDMRRLPEFKALVTELKLVDFWRTTGKWGDFCKPVGADDFECH